MKNNLLVLAVLGVLLVFSATFAQEDPGQCRRLATERYNQCRADCQDVFITEKDGCRNIDHACAEQCRANLAACVAPYQQALDQCFDVCGDTLRTTREECRTIPDPVLKQQCLTSAELANWVCRERCRVTTRVEGKWWRQGMVECRRAARACFKACPPASR